MKRAQLIGKFYYRNLIGSEVFFGYLYQSITIGHAINENGSDDGPEDLSRARLILTVLSSLKDLRFGSDFYSYICEYLAMLRCYLCHKSGLSKEIHELAIDVFKVKNLLLTHYFYIL